MEKVQASAPPTVSPSTLFAEMNALESMAKSMKDELSFYLDTIDNEAYSNQLRYLLTQRMQPTIHNFKNVERRLAIVYRDIMEVYGA